MDPSSITVDTPEHRAAGVSAGLHRLIWSTAWDVLTRGVSALWTFFLLTSNVWDLMQFGLAFHPEMSRAAVATAIAARVGLLAFLAINTLAFLARLKPVAKSTGIGPRAIALTGTMLPTVMAFLPRYESDTALNVASFACMAIGSGLSAFGFAHLNRSASIMAEARRLVTSGPYRLVRHPVYLFEELAVIGVAMNLFWPPRTAVVATVILVAHACCQMHRMGTEERVLESTFPDYAAYRVRTPWRVIPGLY